MTSAAETEDDASVLDLNHDTPGRGLHQPGDLEGPRPRRVRHPLHAAAAAPVRARSRRRRHARAHLDPRHAGVRRREPAQDHGRPRHRRAAGPSGRPRLDQARRANRSTCASRSCRRRTARRSTLRILSQGEAPDSLDALGMWPRSRAALDVRSRSRSAPSSSSARPARARRRRSTRACRCSTRRIAS